MNFLEKFKVGCDIGLKAKTKHPINANAARKTAYKSATKWEKQNAKIEKKALKRK